MMATSFTRIIIVLSLLRSAIGIQQTPPNIVLISLAMFLTLFIMQPTFEKSYYEGVVHIEYTKENVPYKALIPAFMISELRRAFEIGFLIFIPFLIIDMVVASVLMSMGMMMLPPVLISLPFKIIFFVLIDGWAMLSASLVKSFM